MQRGLFLRGPKEHIYTLPTRRAHGLQVLQARARLARILGLTKNNIGKPRPCHSEAWGAGLATSASCSAASSAASSASSAASSCASGPSSSGSSAFGSVRGAGRRPRRPSARSAPSAAAGAPAQQVYVALWLSCAVKRNPEAEPIRAVQIRPDQIPLRDM